jgi:uroporphyrin-III C-methyltransferase/precorrin-2 dehydrogenase/sirohydrochlorin ferrochelatase
LVGAGPGDPELLTLKAVRALRSADVILFDDLVAPEVLDFARREAKRMLVGKTGHRPSCRQGDINALMIGLAKSGRRVVRLKSGDPMIFGRACEEIAALEQAGIAFDVVPGVTAAQGAAASLKQPLTSRGGARRVQLITGHAHTGRLPDDLDLAALADPCATTAVYMPLATLEPFVDRLRTAGVDEGREICAVFSATRPDEHIVRASLDSICAQVGLFGGRGPCLVMVSASEPEAGKRRAQLEPLAAAASGDSRPLGQLHAEALAR